LLLTHRLEGQWVKPVSLTFHSALKNLNTETSIGASHQVPFQLAKLFHRRSFSEIDPSEKELHVAAVSVNALARHSQSSQRTFHRCFLPSFGLFG